MIDRDNITCHSHFFSLKISIKFLLQPAKGAFGAVTSSARITRLQPVVIVKHVRIHVVPVIIYAYFSELHLKIMQKRPTPFVVPY